LFFAQDGIEESAGRAGSAQELACAELARLYAMHVFHLLSIRADKALTSSKPISDVAEKASRLLATLDKAVSVEQIGRQIDSAWSQQCLDAVQDDKVWVVEMLSTIYESQNRELNEDEELLVAVETVLKSADSKFQARAAVSALKKPVASPAEASTPANSNTSTFDSDVEAAVSSIPASMRQSIMRSVDKFSALSPAPTSTVPKPVTVKPDKPSEESEEVPIPAAVAPKAAAGPPKPASLAPNPKIPPSRARKSSATSSSKTKKLIRSKASKAKSSSRGSTIGSKRTKPRK
jgi:hypothetical protein